MKYMLEIKTSPIIALPLNALSPTPHLHTHLELVYIETGLSVATVNGRDHPFGNGDIFLAFPNQLHFYWDRTPIRGQIVIFSAALFPDLAEHFSSRVPVDPIIKSNQLPPDVGKQLVSICEQVNSQVALEQTAAKGKLLSLLSELLQKMELVPCSGTLDNIQSLMRYCMDHYTEPLSLDHLAAALHLNKYYISHLFRERLRVSFPAYINDLRVSHACALLKADKSITATAFDSGFASIRSFNRNFEKIVGKTPSEYLRQHRFGGRAGSARETADRPTP